MIYRLGALLIGYLLGNFMTAEIVTRKLTGRPCRELGTSGNPGMANVMAHLGFKAGITVLIGDLGKCILACLIAWLLFHQEIGRLAVLDAGFGATVGHDFPVLVRDCKGGKGVAVSCMAVFLYNPLWGLAANIAGMLIVFATKYLAVGGVAIPAVFTVFMLLFDGKEAALASLVLTVLAFSRHYSSFQKMRSGEYEKTDVPGEIRKKLKK